MSQNSKKMWQLVMLLAVNLFIMISLSAVMRADALCLGCIGEKVAAVQRALSHSGFYGGEISGEYDFATRKAVKSFQTQNGLTRSGETDYETVSALGLDSRIGECFSVRTELLAVYIEKHGGSDYPSMLLAAEDMLRSRGTFPLSGFIINSEKNFLKTFSEYEPSSEAYAAALEAIRNNSLPVI